MRDESSEQTTEHTCHCRTAKLLNRRDRSNGLTGESTSEMDRNDGGAERKLLRPTAAIKSKAASSLTPTRPVASAETGAAENGNNSPSIAQELKVPASISLLQ